MPPVDREGLVALMRAAADGVADFGSELIAQGGRHLSLNQLRITWAAGFVTEMLHLCETDHHGRVVRISLYGPDDLDTALAAVGQAAPADDGGGQLGPRTTPPRN